MKKFLYLLCAVVLMLSAAVTARAAQETVYIVNLTSDVENKLTTGVSTLPVGEEIMVDVMLSCEDKNVQGYNAFDFTLSYDSEELKFLEGDLHESRGTVTYDDDIIRVKGYGITKAFDIPAVTLFFEIRKQGDVQVELQDTMVGNRTEAGQFDAVDSNVQKDTAQAEVEGFKIIADQDKGVVTHSTVTDGKESITFTLQDSELYDYTYQVLVGENDVSSKVKYDATRKQYVLKLDEDIEDKIQIIATQKTPKTFRVNVNSTYLTGEAEATYNTPYKFQLDRESGYAYTVKVTIDGNAYTKYTVSGNTYTIPGADITGNITLSVTRTKETSSTSGGNKTTTGGNTTGTVTVTFVGTGSEDARGETSTAKGGNYTFRVEAAEGYVYRVKAQMGGKEVACSYNKSKDTYTIAARDVKGNLEIVIEKSPALEITEYAILDGKVLYKIVLHSEVPRGSTARFDGEEMYWDPTGQAYVWLAASELEKETFEAQALDKIAVTKGQSTQTLAKGFDVNQDGRLDNEDIKLVRSIYCSQTTLENTGLAKLLLADVNRDGKVNIQDAAAIVYHIRMEQKEAQKP